MPAKVVVIGSLNMDLVTRASRLPRAGETLIGQTFSTVPGGKGGNQAVACARQGAQVALFGRVGDDGYGHTLRAGLDAIADATDPAATSLYKPFRTMPAGMPTPACSWHWPRRPVPELLPRPHGPAMRRAFFCHENHQNRDLCQKTAFRPDKSTH